MRKGIVTLGVIGIVLSLLFGFGPMVMRLLNDPGLRTADIAVGGEPASTDVNGTWVTTEGYGKNATQAGYTFEETLPGEHKTTSGRADNSDGDNVHGELSVRDGSLQEGKVEVQVDSISSDKERRDVNVRRELLHTANYPTATFSLTDPVDLSSIPADGSVGTVQVRGELTLHGVTRPVTTELKVLRSGESVIVQGNVPVKRSDYHIDTGDFVAAVIKDEGTIDLLLVFQKK